MNNRQNGTPKDSETEAVAGILSSENQLLMIKRSDKVISPGKICFPGGKIQASESLAESISREFWEELNLRVSAKEKVWECVTSWGCKVHWLIVECDPNYSTGLHAIRPDEEEVAEVFWRSPKELLQDEELLESNRYFLEAVEAGEINLPGT